MGESIFQCAARELYEETSIIAERMRIVAIADAGPGNNYYLHLGVLAEEWHGVAENKNPNLCADVAFFPIDNLPTPLFTASVPLIPKFRTGIIYQE